MNNSSKLAYVQSMTGETDSSVLSASILVAGEAILNKMYPFGTNETDVPDRYSSLQCEIAAYLINKRGAEGETRHDENGISRAYEKAYIPDSMLRGVTPFAVAL